MTDKDARDDDDSFMEIIREYPAVYSRAAIPSLSKIVPFDRVFFLIAFFPLVRGLDFVDGAVARHLNQTSAFGAWLDVVLDNISRSMIWTGLMPSYGFLISSVEWATFVCTHQLGRHWKKPSETQPKLVARIMANNFNTPLGHWIMFSLWFFPAWLYALQFYNMPFSLQSIIITTILAVGRTLAFTVEAWFIVQHVVALLGED